MGGEGLAKTETFRERPLDNSQIEIRFVEDPAGKNVREVWLADLLDGPPATELPLDVMGELVAALRVGDEPPPPHVVSHRQTYFSWGADGVAAQLILEVAADYILPGLATSAAYEALKHVVRRLVSQAQSRSDQAHERLSREEAIERARWHLAEAFELGYDAAERLEVVGETVVGGGASWVVRFALEGRRFEVELLDECGLVRVGRLGWSEEAGSEPL
jgi:hypothetical protein